MVFPGNTQGRHIRETGAKGCTIVTANSGQIASVEHHALDVMRWAVCEVDVSAAADADAALDSARTALQRELEAADGRPLAVRLQFSGASAAHETLQAHPEQWIAETRALAGRVGEIWIEKVLFQTRPKQDTAVLSQRDGSFGRILESIEKWNATDSDFDDLIRSLDDLKRKLPPELRLPDSDFNWDTAERRLQLAQSVKQTLLARIMAIGQDV
jgi:hypothetical protein